MPGVKVSSSPSRAGKAGMYQVDVGSPVVTPADMPRTPRLRGLDDMPKSPRSPKSPSSSKLPRSEEPRRHKKFSTLFGYVFCTSITCAIWYLLGACPLLLPWVYAGLYVIFYFVRLYTYSFKRMACFMVDMCYWGNGALVVIIIWAPRSATLFQAVFGFLHGPLIWAIATFNVKHHPSSLDKFISVFIHIVPCLISYVMMWHQKPSTDFDAKFKFGRSWTVCRDEECTVDFMAIWLWPTIFAYAHMLLTGPCQVMPDELGCGSGQMTSYKWMTRNDQQVLVWFLDLLGFEGRWRIFGAYFVAFFANCIFLLPAPLVYGNQNLHAAYILVFFVLAVWNGGVHLESEARKAARSSRVGSYVKDRAGSSAPYQSGGSSTPVTPRSGVGEEAPPLAPFSPTPAKQMLGVVDTSTIAG